MKYFPLFLFSVLFFAFAVSAQTNQDSSCPTISARGGDNAKPNEISYFSADVDAKGKDLKLKYRWFVREGEILEGQGTQTIKVRVPDDGLVVTVEVEGFPEGCQSYAFDSTPTFCFLNPPVILFDEFSIQPLRIDKARLDELVVKLQNNPNDFAYIIEYFKENTSKTIINRKIQKIIDYLVNQKKFDMFSIMIDLKANKTSTRFWIVPPGADQPQP